MPIAKTRSRSSNLLLTHEEEWLIFDLLIEHSEEILIEQDDTVAPTIELTLIEKLKDRHNLYTGYQLEVIRSLCAMHIEAEDSAPRDQQTAEDIISKIDSLGNYSEMANIDAEEISNPPEISN
jgi:hypothetical protein